MNHISVCICTFQRPANLEGLLRCLTEQTSDGCFTFSVVVCDNDAARSAEAAVQRADPALRIDYVHEPRQNIALARNAACARANGDFIAFIDDDELPAQDWLRQLHAACELSGASGVLGPVLPRFAKEAPAWLERSGLYNRKRWPTGTVLPWSGCRTGNVLLRRAALPQGEPPFREQFGEGGEDVDFFRRGVRDGKRFIWCDEAAVYEEVPAARCTRRFLVKRALLRGNIVLNHPEGRCMSIVKSLAAAPAYAVALPFLGLASHALFMRYLVRFCDHGGRLLALCRLNPVQRREP